MNKLNSIADWIIYGGVSVFAALTIIVASPAWAEDEDEDELEFAEAQVLLQLNDTDGDLGFHARIDGEPWKRVTIESPDEQILFDVRLRRALRQQGLTELAFESAEPTFDELDPETFFARFPEGDYEISGKGFEGAEYESTSTLSHLIPAAPDNLVVSGVPASDDCDVFIPAVPSPVVISWDEVVSHHDELGRAGDIEVDSYEVAIEAETVDYQINVEADVTEVTLAAGAIPSGEEVKYQVLVREAEGYESSAESCFIAP